jgi:hypothetical protein
VPRKKFLALENPLIDLTLGANLFRRRRFMDFDSDWITLGRHRVRLRSPRGFPTQGMRTAVDVMRLAIENNMSARARLVDVTLREGKSYDLPDQRIAWMFNCGFGDPYRNECLSCHASIALSSLRSIIG